MTAERPAVDPRWWGPPIGGVAFALAYPPVDLLPLALVGLWPFLWFLDKELENAPSGSWRGAFAGGYLFGLAQYGALLYWIAGLTGFSVMAVPAYVASVMVMAFNGALTAGGCALGRRFGIPVAVSFPLAWTGVEWLRSFGDLGFTWAVAGDVLANYPLLIQPAELGGVYLLSLWVVALSTAAWRLVRPRSDTPRTATAAMVVVVAAAVPAYGALRLDRLERQLEGWPTLRAAAIQPNVPQDMKWEEAFETEIHRRLSVLTLRVAPREPELVVWPESAVPSWLRYDPRTRALVPALAAQIEAPIFTGTNDADTLTGRSGREAGDYRVYNAAYLVRPDSIVSNRYAKQRLVPVAERVPFVPGMATGFFERLSAWTGQFSRGEEWTTWTVEGFEFGALICYESVFPSVSRALVLEGADFLLNITNDAWFGRTAAPYQHASHLSLRAVEHRVPFLRSANTGISGWVDPLGRWRERTPLYEPATVVADLPIPGGGTPYTRWGDWLPFACVLAWGGLALVGAARARTAPRGRGSVVASSTGR
ncbi:MAG: apolipoprotein N-acyltransferase [Gemmatimonadetes bacterium]|nr:apolipoprotein N-acyltransferase [Gemmatimonadota bacterium]